MIYLDWAATTPLHPHVFDAMKSALVADASDLWANPNSLHSAGRASFAALEDARVRVARLLGARGDEIVFTSGATEANNAALQGLTYAALTKRHLKLSSSEKPRVIVSALEHDCVLNSARRLESQGFEVEYLKPNPSGFINPESLAEALTPSTLLVSIMGANNEIGVVQPLQELCDIAHRAGALFHSDLVQMLGKYPINLKALKLDAASFSGHKIQGPKGVGVLYLKARTPFEPLLVGGSQESNKRSGTQNVAGALGFARALELASEEQEPVSARCIELRDYLYQELSQIQGVQPSISVPKGSRDYLPHIVNILVQGFESETLIMKLDALGFAVSGGSACSSASLAPSHVLSSLGIAPERALGSLRISFGYSTTQEELTLFCNALRSIIED